MSSKEEIIAAIRRCAEKLGKNPSFAHLRKMEPSITVRTLLKHFHSYTLALRAAGLEPYGGGHQIAIPELLKDWAATARRMGKLPTMLEYENHEAARYSSGPYHKRFGKWGDVPQAFLRYAKVEHCEAEWADVLELIEQQKIKNELERAANPERQAKRGSTGVRFLEGRPVYGPPVAPYGMAHEPGNEASVLFLFGAVAPKLGMVISHVQTEFPDCEAFREVEPGKWQRWRIEVEYRSRNFLVHGHDPAGCDMIVCWVHDWAGCPEEIEVVELKTQIAKIAGIARSED